DHLTAGGVGQRGERAIERLWHHLPTNATYAVRVWERRPEGTRPLPSSSISRASRRLCRPLAPERKVLGGSTPTGDPPPKLPTRCRLHKSCNQAHMLNNWIKYYHSY